MTNWKVWRLFILLALVGVFGWLLYTRGVPGRMGGQPAAALQTEYKTETEWAVRQSALDIEEMAAYADRREPKPLPAALPGTPWDVDAFETFADAAFGDAGSLSTGDATDLYPALTALDVTALIAASKTISGMLAANMRNPRAHESAALVIGAFAMRDAADKFTDVRWAMNRMTAHLAAARALRTDDSRSPDGAIAQTVLLVLANHQARAIVELGTLGTGTPPEPMNAWNRALQMRLTQDWRLLPDPAAATRLEKLEYFRAKRNAARRLRASQLLVAVNEPVAADFARIAQDNEHTIGVEDGHEFLRPALELELDEAASAYQLVHGRAFPESLTDALNQRATRLVGAEPQVLPWGAWAEFYQRHLAMHVGWVDTYERHMQSDHAAADRASRALDARLGGLTLFPLGTARRTKGTYGTEADLAYLRDVVALAAEAPELVPVPAWRWFENGVRYEPVATGMPESGKWFARVTPAVPYEAGIRLAQGVAIEGSADAVVSAAPYDMALLLALAPRGEDPAAVRATTLLERNHDYDLRALEASMTAAPDEASRIPLRKKACAFSSRDCLQLASSLLHFSDDEAAAAAVYAQAFGDPQIDALARAADAHWLVMYYYRNGLTDKAVALAQEVAATGSANGFHTRGILNERLGNFDGAEEDFIHNAQAYREFEGLLGFYYRRVEVDRMEAYRAKWERWRAEVFPNGLQPAPTVLAGVPKTGVFIERDSELSRLRGIRTGDIVVGLEGWRVDSVQQYTTINGFTDDPVVKLTISRGGQLITIEPKSPTRRFATYLQTHPMKGWIQN